MNGTTSVPKSVLRLVLDKARQLLVNEDYHQYWYSDPMNVTSFSSIPYCSNSENWSSFCLPSSVS